MGLRCLIGHDFGEVLTERDREEAGEEVVVTVREYRECARCGEVRVVSENKEVRHRDAGPAAAEESAPTEPDAATAAADYAGDGDDGIILEDEPEESAGRAHGAWPEEDEVEAADADAEPSPWPEVEGEDEGYSAETGDDRPLEGVEFGSGLTPEAAASDPSQAQLDEEVIESAGGEGGFRRATPGPSPTGRQRSQAAETEFFCPECQYTTPTEDSSLRPGDICPECRLGYLTERER